MSELVWEDPPLVDRSGDGPRRGRWIQTSRELREHPGKWALVLSGATWNEMNSAYAQLKAAGCEATCRGATVQMRIDKSPTGSVYARWPEDAS